MFIVSQEELEAFCRRAKQSAVLAIDTEFMREKTYYAKLCLVQMATETESVLIDPFAVADLTVLADLLTDEHIVKLFHAGTQDIEILYREVGVLPSPVFDTQIAAALLGHTQQIGYAALVHSVCGVTIKKTDSYTDWSRRPLSESQRDYALNDVLYLGSLYTQMSEELRAKGRLQWLTSDFEALVDPTKYEIDERERFRRLKRVSSLSRRQLAAAREVAAWRELHAQMRDIPRKWVMTDEQVVEACKREARSIDELFMVRGLSDKLSTKDAREVAALMKAALDSAPSTWPELDKCGKSEPNVDMQIDLMSALVRVRAKENDVAFQTLASHADLTRIARGYRSGIELLQGWRAQIVGEELIDLLEGRIRLSIDGSTLVVMRCS